MRVRDYYQPKVHAILEGLPKPLLRQNLDVHQKWMSKKMQRMSHVLIGAFMGSGKTAAALHAAWVLWKKGKLKKVLVVAPKNVAIDTWPEEILTWDFSREFRYAVICGEVDQRERALRIALASSAEITIINRENYKWLTQKVSRAKWPWDTLIYDEASRLSGGKETTKEEARPDGTIKEEGLTEFGRLVKTRNRFSRVWELSGTPATEGVANLWGPVFLLDHGKALGHTKAQFMSQYFRYNPSFFTYQIRPYAEEEILDRVKGLMFTLKEEDYLELPPLQIRDRIVSLPPALMKRYRKLEREMALEDINVEAVNRGVLASKLLQFANGSVYAKEDEDQVENLKVKPKAVHIHNVKLDELGSIFEEAGGRPVLIAYSYKFDVHAILKRYPFVRMYGQTKNDKRDWNLGRLKGMILHPASAGHGLNFQHGGNIACWYGLNPSLELYQQFNRRLKRRGQKASFVRLYRILARGTRDMRTAEMLEEKAITQDRISEFFRVTPEDMRRGV